MDSENIVTSMSIEVVNLLHESKSPGINAAQDLSGFPTINKGSTQVFHNSSFSTDQQTPEGKINTSNAAFTNIDHANDSVLKVEPGSESFEIENVPFDVPRNTTNLRIKPGNSPAINASNLSYNLNYEDWKIKSEEIDIKEEDFKKDTSSLPLIKSVVQTIKEMKSVGLKLEKRLEIKTIGRPLPELQIKQTSKDKNKEVYRHFHVLVGASPEVYKPYIDSDENNESNDIITQLPKKQKTKSSIEERQQNLSKQFYDILVSGNTHEKMDAIEKVLDSLPPTLAAVDHHKTNEQMFSPSHKNI